VDFLPYEGGQLRDGREWQRLAFVVSIAAVMLTGAWGLRECLPTPQQNLLESAEDEGPTTTVPKLAGGDTNAIPAKSEAELSGHPKRYTAVSASEKHATQSTK
jgi:hypothetical protein